MRDECRYNSRLARHPARSRVPHLVAAALGFFVNVAFGDGRETVVAKTDTGTLARSALRAHTVQSLRVGATGVDFFSVVVTLDDRPQILTLHKHSLRKDNFRVMVQGGDGELVEVPAPRVQTYRGLIEGLTGSVVAASIDSGRLYAQILLASGERWHVQPARESAVGVRGLADHLVYRDDDIIPQDWRCGAGSVGHVLSKFLPREESMEASPGGGMRICDLAFDSDVEFFQANGSSVAATVRDIETVMNNVSALYEMKVNIAYELTTIVVRTAEPDPYTSFDNLILLDEFAGEWNANMQGVHRDVAHLMTGRSVDDGVIGTANVDVMCDVCGNARGYGFSQSRFSGLLSSRACLTTHELGHNWGADHCDGDMDCAIMCSRIGSCTGDCTQFGSTAFVDIVTESLSALCLETQAPPLTPPFCEMFSGAVDPSHWTYNVTAEVSEAASDPPSPPFALLLDGCCAGCLNLPAPDDVRSNEILLSGLPGATLSYYTQQSGGLISMGSQLVVEYHNDSGAWVEVNRITSTGIDQEAFDFWSHDLPPDALHDEFRIRLRLAERGDNGQWFVDDVSIATVRADQPVLYVRADAPAGGLGTNWKNAFANLQDALAAAECSLGLVEEIWVAQGTYLPDRGTRNRAESFRPLNGVTMYGGFAGWETQRDERNPAAHPTILSGEIGDPGTGDNSYHVVDASGTNESAVLDGFTITAGSATDATPNDGGAGVLCVLGSPTIRNCTIRENRGVFAGGVFNFGGGHLRLTNCTFIDNEAAIAWGGGLVNELGSSVTIKRCRFLGNSAALRGGAIYNAGSILSVESSLFSGNMAAMGAAIYNVGGTVNIEGCTVVENHALSSVGGILTNSGNTNVKSSVLWGNSDPGGTTEVAQLDGAVSSVDYSCIQGLSGALGGKGNIGDDPMFVDVDGVDNIVGTSDDDAALTAASPAIDAGDLAVVFEFGERDLTGVPRVLCGRIDMGAYELGAGDIDCSGETNLADYISWPDCMNGPGGPSYAAGCEAFDFENDGDVDLLDLSVLQRSLR